MAVNRIVIILVINLAKMLFTQIGLLFYGTLRSSAQWFKPLVKNGQNLKEFEYRDVVYVYRGFRPWEIDFREKNLRKSNILGARGAFKTDFLQISRFLALASEQSHSQNLKAAESGFFTLKIQILKEFFY